MRAWMGGLALVASGCNLILGIESATLEPIEPDAAQQADAGTPDAFLADAMVVPVVGTSAITRAAVPFTGTVAANDPVAEDLSGYQIAVWLPTATGYRIYEGAGTAEGTFEVPGVPVTDRYLLRFQRPDDLLPIFYQLTTRTPDMGFLISGRASLATAPASTQLSLTLTGSLTTPSGGTAPNRVAVYNFNQSRADLFSWFFGASSPPLNHVFDYAGTESLDAAVGDFVFATTQTSFPTGTSPSVVVLPTDSATFSGITQLPGETASGSSALAAIATTPQTLTWDGPSHQPVVSRSNGSWSGAFYKILAFPRPLIEHGSFGVSVATFEVGGGIFAAGSLQTFGPYPRAQLEATLMARTGLEWIPYAQTFIEVRREYRIPGGSILSIPAGLETWSPVIGATEAIAPRVQPVRQPTLDGVNILNDVEIPFGSGNPVLAWSAPEAGPSNFYRVAVREFGLDAGTTTEQTIAVFDVRTTELAIPRELLAENHFYSFTIINVADGSFATRPRDPFVTAIRGEAALLTGMVRLIP
jgi:hypothetical protein